MVLLGDSIVWAGARPSTRGGRLLSTPPRPRVAIDLDEAGGLAHDGPRLDRLEVGVARVALAAPVLRVREADSARIDAEEGPALDQALVQVVQHARQVWPVDVK